MIILKFSNDTTYLFEIPTLYKSLQIILFNLALYKVVNPNHCIRQSRTYLRAESDQHKVSPYNIDHHILKYPFYTMRQDFYKIKQNWDLLYTVRQDFDISTLYNVVIPLGDIYEVSTLYSLRPPRCTQYIFDITYFWGIHTILQSIEQDSTPLYPLMSPHYTI